jgi:WS/DGAT/MGAT family acyltransferase
VRHTSLPLPGDERQLKRLVARIMSQKLDRSKPMWEMWFVEGLEGGHCAVISKVHHCLIDGISGVDLLSAFMGPDPDYRPEAIDHRWVPRPPPSRLGMLADEGLADSISPASDTPLNVPIGPHRRFDWTRMDLGVAREVKTRLGGTLNDVMLGCVAGAVRGFLEGRGLDVSELDFRVFIPVSTRSARERGKLGNRVSMIISPLPVSEPDPRVRMERIIEQTAARKASGRSEGAELLEELSDWTFTSLLSGMSRLASSRRSYNLVVTNVPGPPFPVFLGGARLRESYPLVPLFENQALGIALFSYDKSIHWGFNADWDAIPDLHELVLGVEREFEVLRKL